jgi:2-keto-3-deoxy-L-rhamnonate aldolase RhmA
MPKPEDFDRYYDLGFRFLASGSDGAMVNNAARALGQTLASKRGARG